MTRHQDHGGVALCTGKAPNPTVATLTRFWESVSCCRCRRAVTEAMRKMGKKEPTREVIAAAKKEAGSTSAPPSRPRTAGNRAR